MTAYFGYRAIFVGLFWGIGLSWYGRAHGDGVMMAVGLVIGVPLVGMGLWAVFVARARRRLEETPVPEAPDAGAFWRRDVQQ